MGGARYRGLRRPVAVVFFVASVALLLAGSTAAGGPARSEFRVLQLNLCNSGIAGCYTGRAVAWAAAVIRVDRPDVVAFNEVCRDDVYGLYQALRDRYDGNLAWAFQAAGDRRTGGEFRCRNGQPYGIGLLARLGSPHRGYTTAAGLYPIQDLRDPEERAWLCLHAVGSFLACTTHLASTSPSVALAQCHHLLDTSVPTARGPDGDEPTVVAGDFNLGHGPFNADRSGADDVQACVPAGYLRQDDGAVQQVIATIGFTVSSVDLIDMHGTTDHPGLLVSYTEGQ
jgi:hypothetical protein